MSYLAYLCYRTDYDDDNELLNQTVTVEFERPQDWKYNNVIPIQFSPLNAWSNKDKELFKC